MFHFSSFSLALFLCLACLLAVICPVSAANIYTVRIKNNSKKNWNFALYQDYTSEPGLVGTIFKVVRLARNSQGGIHFKLQFGAAVVNFVDDCDLGVPAILNSKVVDTELGASFLVFDNDGYTDIRLALPSDNLPSADDGSIIIANKYGINKDVALIVDGNAVAVFRSLNTNAQAQFRVQPTFYIAAFTEVAEGQLVDYNAAVEPIEISFGQGSTDATYVLDEDSNGRLAAKVLFK